MSVTDYLDLAYAVTVEDRVRRGANLLDALDATRDWAAKSAMDEVVTTATVPAGGNTYQSSERVDPGGPGAPVTAEEMKSAEAASSFLSQLGSVRGIK